MPSRGTYRSLYTCIQDDPDFQALPPDARLVFYTLKFSPLGNVAGIFVYHVEAILRHSGLTRSRFEGALRALLEGSWVLLQGHLIWIRNGLRYEPGYSLADQNKKTGIEKMLAGLPRLAIIRNFCNYYGCEAPPGTPSEPLPEAPPGTPSKPSFEPPAVYRSGSGSRSTETDLSLSAPQNGAARQRGYSPGFEAFWGAYPNTEGTRKEKGEAFKVWKEMKLETSTAEIVSALRKQDDEDSWFKKDGRRCIPYPARWLKRKRFDDAV